MAEGNSFWISAMPSERTHNGAPTAMGNEFFYVPPAHFSGSEVQIEGEEFAHLTQVMRHGSGDLLTIVDGVGNAYTATLNGIRGRTAICTVISRLAMLNEPSVHLTLGVSILKNPSRFDLVVEKCTELGVGRIVPLTAERTVPRHARIERWQNIAVAAMKQSGRCVLPVVAPLTAFSPWVSTVRGERMLLHELAATPLGPGHVPASGAELTVGVGPEGGFTDQEVAAAQAAGWGIFSVGARRLRSETAAIVAAVRLLIGS